MGAAADAAVAAFRAGDKAALAELAKRDEPDPWLVADEMCARGVREAAEAFALAAPRKDVERLASYVRKVEIDPAPRAALATASAHAAAGRDDEAMAALSGLTPRTDVISVRVADARGTIAQRGRRLSEAADALEAAADLAKAIGWHAREAVVLSRGGECAYRGADFDRSLRLLERAVALEEARGDPGAASGLLVNMGIIEAARGREFRALDLYERGFRQAEAAHLEEWAENALANMGNLCVEVGDRARGVKHLREARRRRQERNDVLGVARVDVGIATAQIASGEFREASALLESALATFRDAGDRPAVAAVLLTRGNLLEALGQYARAFDDVEEALALCQKLSDRVGVLKAQVNLGHLYVVLDDPQTATAILTEALAGAREIGARAIESKAFTNLIAGETDPARTIALWQQAMKYDRARDDRAGVASAQGNIAIARIDLRDYRGALELMKAALETLRDLHDVAGQATLLLNMSFAHLRLRQYEEAGACIAEGRRIAEDLGVRRTVLHGLRAGAELAAALGRHDEAIALAELGVREAMALVGGLGEDLAASGREHWNAVVEVGVRSAMARGDPAKVFSFVESGRGRELLAALGGRTALLAATIPGPLREEEADARGREALAAARCRAAQDGGDRDEVRRTRAELEQARVGVEAVIARIRRQARAGAEVVYPEPAALPDIQAQLGTGEILVLYELMFQDAVALVVSRDEARLVPLGRTAGIEASCAALDVATRTTDPAGRVEALRRLVLDPLKLPAHTRRIVVSPDAALCYVPFTLLASGIDVSYAPSATTYGFLLERRETRGSGVLALGDPRDPEGRADRTRRLVPLPGTRDEAMAVGDHALLGESATEASLRAALGERDRWRAVHLACHGVFDPAHPRRSSLMLAADDAHDGVLGCREVFGLSVPANLVVLSACETAKGKVYRGEGVVGLPRAFMFAGAPRVIASLWKVDDEATRALMTRFYELWNPRGGEGMAAAAALRKAQEHVAAEERWRHPAYWAAWQLWGLAD